MMNFNTLTAELSEIRDDIQELQAQKVAYANEIKAIEDNKFKRVVESFKQMEELARVYGVRDELLFNSHIELDGYYVHFGLYMNSDHIVELKVYKSRAAIYYKGYQDDFLRWIELHNSYARTYANQKGMDATQKIVKALMEEWDTLEPLIEKEFAEGVKRCMNAHLHEVANETNRVLAQLKQKQSEA